MTAPGSDPTLEEIIEARLTRRRALQGLAGVAVASLLPRGLAAKVRLERPQTSLTFTEIENRITRDHRVAPGYDARVLLRWGDPVFAGAPPFDPHALTSRDQARQFGFNNDFIAFLPLPARTSSSDRGLLCVNHEYTDPNLMWSGSPERLALSAEQTAIEIAAHGHSVVEVRRGRDGWRARPNGALNRRLTATTAMKLSGPAAGHRRLRTAADPSGRRVIGTLNNCAGGVTPWGTVLIAEENFNKYFAGDYDASPEAESLRRYGFTAKYLRYGWWRFDPRFDVDQEPREANRFGWIVEFDPYDPFSTPVKRTALGRFRHEGAACVLNRDGRVAVYSGDDQRFEYVYKFVTHGRCNPNRRVDNLNLLDNGTLFVARFDDDGTGRWLPLVFGANGLTPENGFDSQAEVLIDARRAADLLGATKMDRPEDVEANPVTGKVYVNLTKNRKRRPDQVDAANERAENHHGHILEIDPPRDASDAADHGALDFRWEVFLRAGNPSDPSHGARYHSDTTGDGWFNCPDNCTFDPRGRLWISTDQGEFQKGNGIPDGLRACDTEGPGRALTRLFYACPIGAELCGPCFTPDGRTLFVAVQHPGEGDHLERDVASTFDDPATRWPDFQDGVPPRPSVVAITRRDGGEIGGPLSY